MRPSPGYSAISFGTEIASNCQNTPRAFSFDKETMPEIGKPKKMRKAANPTGLMETRTMESAMTDSEVCWDNEAKRNREMRNSSTQMSSQAGPKAFYGCPDPKGALPDAGLMEGTGGSFSPVRTTNAVSANEFTPSVAMVVLSEYPADPRVRREAEALARAGILVDILCLNGGNQSAFEEFGNISVYRIAKARPKEHISAYLLSSLQFTVLAFLNLHRLSFRKKYHLLQVHNMPDFLVFSGLLLKLTGVPILLDLHDLMPELFQSRWSQNKARILLPLVKAAEKLSCGVADHLLTTSKGFENSLVQRGRRKNKITLILNSADERIFKNSRARRFRTISGDPRLIYHGTVAPRFGLSTAIEAVRLLIPRFPNLTFRIYGKYDPSCKSEIERQILTCNLQDHVFLNGYITQEAVADVIASSDIGIVPYLSDVFMEKALSTKCFEYVAMGLPVVASELESISSHFGSSSISYFRSGSAEGLAERVQELCANSGLRKNMSGNALAEYLHISWSVMEHRYLQAVRALI